MEAQTKSTQKEKHTDKDALPIEIRALLKCGANVEIQPGTTRVLVDRKHLELCSKTYFSYSTEPQTPG